MDQFTLPRAHLVRPAQNNFDTSYLTGASKTRSSLNRHFKDAKMAWATSIRPLWPSQSQPFQHSQARFSFPHTNPLPSFSPSYGHCNANKLHICTKMASIPRGRLMVKVEIYKYLVHFSFPL